MNIILKKLSLSLCFMLSTFSIAQIVTESTLWEAKQMNDIYLVKIKPGVELNTALGDFVNSKEISHAILQGSGDLKSVALDNEKFSKSKKINSVSDLTALSGNLSLVDGIKTWDLKGVISTKKLKAFLGNINNATVDNRVEVYIYPIDYKLHKSTNQLTGVPTFDFTK